MQPQARQQMNTNIINLENFYFRKRNIDGVFPAITICAKSIHDPYLIFQKYGNILTPDLMLAFYGASSTKSSIAAVSQIYHEIDFILGLIKYFLLGRCRVRNYHPLTVIKYLI